MLTILMVVDAIVAIGLIAVILGQEPKSGGMGGLDGSASTVFSGKVRGIEGLLARMTVVLAVCFVVITLIIAKMIM